MCYPMFIGRAAAAKHTALPKSPIGRINMDAITTAIENLENTRVPQVQNAIEAMTYAQLSGLYDALETARKLIERIQSSVEGEIGVRQWEGVAA